MSEKQKQKPPYNPYFKYAGMAFQMGAIIFIGMFGGMKLDQWTGLDKRFPIFTIVLSLAAVFGAMYSVIKDFIKK